MYLDATIGCGGHARAILDSIRGEGMVIGIDQDYEAIEIARQVLQKNLENVILINDNFSNLAQILQKLKVMSLQGALFDLGVSSIQLDRKQRGFSYQEKAPLDMRMDQKNPFSAAHIINSAPEKELTRIIRDYGEERWAARIASFIVKRRERKPLQTTTDLVEVIKDAIPAAARRSGPHPARRTFQAFRIAVNNELNIIKPALETAVRYLAPGGRIAVITFHSLEDRIVKETFQEMAQKCKCPPFLPRCQCGGTAKIKIINKKPITASPEEVAENPRARTAKLRAAEKLV